MALKQLNNKVQKKEKLIMIIKEVTQALGSIKPTDMLSIGRILCFSDSALCYAKFSKRQVKPDGSFYSLLQRLCLL